MGTYVVTGGSHGIGAATVKKLMAQGHKVISTAIDSSDIDADLGTPEGRQLVIDTLHKLSLIHILYFNIFVLCAS